MLNLSEIKAAAETIEDIIAVAGTHAADGERSGNVYIPPDTAEILRRVSKQISSLCDRVEELENENAMLKAQKRPCTVARRLMDKLAAKDAENAALRRALEHACTLIYGVKPDELIRQAQEEK
ncbi:hypothetical protein [Ethanoligenens sp.]|uniref:hypothetical protein n=1 Tax=Ethanoligenens sp. TaxID=2099655 RepID=UPI0039E96397